MRAVIVDAVHDKARAGRQPSGGTRRLPRGHASAVGNRPNRLEPALILSSRSGEAGLEVRIAGPAQPAAGQQTARGDLQRIEFRAMGCRIVAMIETSGSRAAGRLAQVPGWFETWEAAFSRFRADSELNRINGATGIPVAVSPLMWDVLGAARQASRLSGGIVTPSVLPALEAAGYDRSFELVAQGSAGRPATPAADWQRVEFDSKHRSIRLPRGMRLDLGGVAKGWAAERAAHRLAVLGPALVQAGGDIAVSGPRGGGAAWHIGIADPADPERDIASMHVLRGGVATSGIDHRRWLAGGVWRHHLIDPRSGAPAVTDVLSATVWAESLRRAETAAKVITILGSVAGMCWAVEQGGLEGLVVRTDGTQCPLHAAGAGLRRGQAWR